MEMVVRYWYMRDQPILVITRSLIIPSVCSMPMQMVLSTFGKQKMAIDKLFQCRVTIALMVSKLLYALAGFRWKRLCYTTTMNCCFYLLQVPGTVLYYSNQVFI